MADDSACPLNDKDHRRIERISDRNQTMPDTWIKTEKGAKRYFLC